MSDTAVNKIRKTNMYSLLQYVLLCFILRRAVLTNGANRFLVSCKEIYINSLFTNIRVVYWLYSDTSANEWLC